MDPSSTDGHSSGHARHIHGDSRVGRAVVPKLAVVIRSPALHAATLQQRTCEAPSCGHSHRSGHAKHSDGNSGQGVGAAIPKFTTASASPALYATA